MSIIFGRLHRRHELCASYGFYNFFLTIVKLYVTITAMTLNAIKQMETYARYNPHVVSLSQGIPYHSTDNAIRLSVVEALLQNKVDAYSDPQGLLLLRNKISEMLLEDNMQYNEDEILITAGATEGLMATILSLLSAWKTEIIIPTPSYSAYYKIVESAKGKPVFLPLKEENGWSLTMQDVKKSISKQTAAILLCNPNNPTGTLYSKEELLSICSIAKQKDIKVILDEVYGNMLFDNAELYTPCVLGHLKETVIRVVSFSKDFSLTGWRVAFLHSDKKVIQRILPVHDALVNCAPVISQYAAVAAIENKERTLTSNETIYTENRALMQRYLDRLHDYLAYQTPKGTYFFFPRFLEKQNSTSFCLQLLEKEHVAVVPGSDFGPGGEYHIRLCFGRKKEDIIKGMEGLTRFLVNTI
jgi:aspartate/methionine/tyrosine aminotransferase